MSLQPRKLWSVLRGTSPLDCRCHHCRGAMLNERRERGLSGPGSVLRLKVCQCLCVFKPPVVAQWTGRPACIFGSTVVPTRRGERWLTRDKEASACALFIMKWKKENGLTILTSVLSYNFAGGGKLNENTGRVLKV